MMDTKALREKVLDLAIRGKLVPQDPNDEPASILLERIRQQKQQMVKDGKLKAKDIKHDTVIFVGEDNLHYEKFADGSVKCIEDEIPFELPDGWAWARLSMVGTTNIGLTYKPTEVNETGTIVLRSCNIKNGKMDFADLVRVQADIRENQYIYENDILICARNGSRSLVGKCAIMQNLPEAASFGAFMAVFRSICNQYVYHYFNTSLFRSSFDNDDSKQINQVTQAILRDTLIPLPPFTEQTRIVTKLHELLSLVDFINDSTDQINTIITNAKSKILDLAIRGQLVPQDPADEPASVLLERIRAEKEELIKQGKIKRDKKESVIFRGEDNSYYEKIGSKVENIDDEIPFELPDNWAWCRGYSCFEGMASTKPQGEFFDYIDIDAIDNRLHQIKEAKHLPVSDAPSRASRAVKNGSVLFSLVRPYLENIALIEEKHSHCIASTGFYICNSNGVFLPKFMFYLMISGYVVGGLNQHMKGDNSPSISKDNIENWLYPVPPVEEQKTICAKLQAVFALIESVEKSLS